MFSFVVWKRERFNFFDMNSELKNVWCDFCQLVYFFLISISRNHKNNLIINNFITLLKNIIKLNKNISYYK